MSRIAKIGHAVLHVSDLAASKQWYQDILGMEVVIEGEDFRGCFLSFGERDHDIALFEAPDVPKQEFHHLAFEFDGDLDGFKGMHRHLLEGGVEITGTVDHGISYGIYFLDPDGHQLEVFFQRTAAEEDDRAAFRRSGILVTPIDIQTLPA